MKKLVSLLLGLMLLLTPAAALGETVTASFFPVYVFALNLLEGVEGVEVSCLSDPGAGCLHDYQLQTGDMKALARADAFLICGAGMEGYMAGVFEAFPEMRVVDASVGVTLLESCETHDDHDDHEGHDHAVNAHIWLDAENAALMVKNLAAGLAEAFPQHAEAILANRDAYVARLTALDAEITEALSTLERRDVITFHEAFPYFATAYGLHVAAVINREPDDALSPRQLAELVKLVQSLGNPPMFVEPQYEDAAAQTISRETGAGVYTLDPVVTGPAQDVPLSWYEDVMRRNVQVLLTALGEKE